MSWVDNFNQVLGGLSEAYAEVVTADNAGANPAVYNQTQTAIEPTGQPQAATTGGMAWLSANWLLLLLGIGALFLFIFLIKWLL